MADNTDNSWSQVMWRVSLPLAALNLALLAIPLGAVNPRLGRSGDILIAGLVGLLYMNLMNLSRAWIANGKLSFGVGVWAIHGLVALLTFFLLMRRLRVKAPRNSPAALRPWRLPAALGQVAQRVLVPASRPALRSADLRMNSHSTLTRLSLRRSSWQYIQNERVISTSCSSTGVSRDPGRR